MRKTLLTLSVVFCLLSALSQAVAPNRRLNFKSVVVGGGVSNTPVLIASNIWATASGDTTGTKFTLTVSGYHPMVYIAATAFNQGTGMVATNTTTGTALTLRYSTNSYNAADSSKVFADTSPTAGSNTYLVTNSSGNSFTEFAGIALVITNVNASTPFGTVNAVRNSVNKTGITNTLTTVSNDLALHFVFHNTTGSGGFDPTQTLIGNANDGAGDASVKAAWTNTTFTSTQLRLTNATSSIFEDIAEAVKP